MLMMDFSVSFGGIETIDYLIHNRFPFDFLFPPSQDFLAAGGVGSESPDGLWVVLEPRWRRL